MDFAMKYGFNEIYIYICEKMEACRDIDERELCNAICYGCDSDKLSAGGQKHGLWA